MKPSIVVSGVNLVDFGPLSVFRDALQSLVHHCGFSHEIIALVHTEALVAVPGITYLEFPKIKRSWFRRLHFEYVESLKISKRLQPDVWIAMDNATPRVQCQRQIVYCHNPSPFYRFRWKEAFLDPKFGLFTLFYRFLYRVFLRRNSAVIVQQDWIRKAFQKLYGITNVIVAKPTVDAVENSLTSSSHVIGDTYRFFFPALSRTFKNHELLLESVRLLEHRGIRGFEVILTVNATSNRCGADLYRRYSTLCSVRWLGNISRDRVYELYGEVDCLIFPSKLETWGLPLTEFKTTGKPILAVDLPYAHETIGSYDRVAFFDVEDAAELSILMEDAISGLQSWRTVVADPIPEPYAKDWAALWELLISQNSFGVPIVENDR